MSLNLGNTRIKDIYVGSTKIKEVYLGSSKVYGLNQIFYVTVIQPNGGTITATPVKGPNGTEVILYNSPSTNYEFGSYSVTGATLSGNKFIINNSDVTVTGSFNLYQQDWVNLGSTEYSVSGGTSSTVWSSLTGMPSSSTLDYFTIIFDAYLDSGNSGASDIYLGNSSNQSVWRMRAHYEQSYPGFLGMTSNIINWTPAPDAPPMGSYYLDRVYYNYCPSKFVKAAYARFKIAFDRPNRLGYLYIDDTLLGYVEINLDPIVISKFGLMSEVGLTSEIAKMKNIKVSGFNTLERAQEWS